MMHKPIRNAAVLLLALAVLVTSVALAGTRPQETDIAKPLYLKCGVEKLTQKEIVLIIVNNTTQAVPKGKKIYWGVNRGVKGSFVLEARLAPGRSLRRTEKPAPPGSYFSFNPQPEPPQPIAAKAWWYMSSLGS